MVRTPKAVLGPPPPPPPKKPRRADPEARRFIIARDAILDRHPRRTFMVCVGPFEQNYTGRRGLESVIAEEVEAMRGVEVDADDRAIWTLNRATCKLAAVVSPGPDGEPIVTRFGPRDEDPAAKRQAIRQAADQYRRTSGAWLDRLAEADRLAGPIDVVAAFENGPLDAAAREQTAACDRFQAAIRAAGARCVRVNGTIYMVPDTSDPRDREASEKEDFPRCSAAEFLDLDAEAPR